MEQVIMKQSITKRAYIKLIETYAMNGYDISDMLNPTYKNIDAQKCIDISNQILEESNGADFWDYSEKLTLENL
jgi:hypothetical protein